MFEKFLKGISKDKLNTEKTESKKLLDSYISTKKHIEHLEEKYDDFVLKSLQEDYNSYKDFVDVSYPTLSNQRTHWMISEMRYDTILLEKKDTVNRVALRVDYEFYRDVFKVNSSRVVVDNNVTELNESKIYDIIFQYFIYYQLKGKEREREEKKKSFQKMVDIIGKDVKRDTLIDKILS